MPFRVSFVAICAALILVGAGCGTKGDNDGLNAIFQLFFNRDEAPESLRDPESSGPGKLQVNFPPEASVDVSNMRCPEIPAGRVHVENAYAARVNAITAAYQSAYFGLLEDFDACLKQARADAKTCEAEEQAAQAALQRAMISPLDGSALEAYQGAKEAWENCDTAKSGELSKAEKTCDSAYDLHKSGLDSDRDYQLKLAKVTRDEQHVQLDEIAKKCGQAVMPSTTGRTGDTIEAVLYQGKYLPTDQLLTRRGPGCKRDGVEVLHWHAAKGFVIATDGSFVADPGNCAFGVMTENPAKRIPKAPTAK